ncbi:MAG: hypothetical protein ACK5LY_00510 [Lachnospirales bacterium]
MNYLVKEIKSEVKLVLVLFIGMLGISLGLNAIPSIFNFYWVNFYVGALSILIVPICFFNLLLIYGHLLDIGEMDIWVSVPFSKNKFYNFMLIRSIVGIWLPYIIILLIKLYLIYTNAEGVTLSIDNGYKFLNEILRDLLMFFIFVFFFITSGRLSSLLINVVSMTIVLNIYSTVLMSKEYIFFIFLIVCIGLFFYYGKKLYNLREVENLGSGFLFKKFDTVLPIVYTTLIIGFISYDAMNTIADGDILRLFLSMLLISFVVYALYLRGFRNGFNEIFDKVKYACIPIGVSAIAMLIAIYF